MDLPQFDKFDIQKRVDHRLCFTVYEARDTRTGIQVALKVLDPELATNENNIVNFLGGARIIKHLNHPNVFRVLDLGNDPKEGHYYIAEESSDLKSLSESVLEKQPFSPQDLFDILLIAGKTLRYTHLHGLVHGFLNPNSIFRQPDGAIKIADFGFNWFIPTLLQESHQQALYYAQYVSPEYYRKIENVDGRGDIYSLGLLLYELIAGKHPYQGNTMSSIQNHHMSGELQQLDLPAAGLPPEIGVLIRDSVNKNRELRYQNLREYLRAVEKIKNNQSVTDTQPVQNDDLNIVIQPEQSEKYFDDVAFLENRTKGKRQSQRKPLFRPKLALSGAGALFLVVLILFVTNYIPFPFMGKSGQLPVGTELQVAPAEDNLTSELQAMPANETPMLDAAPESSPDLALNTLEPPVTGAVAEKPQEAVARPKLPPTTTAKVEPSKSTNGKSKAITKPVETPAPRRSVPVASKPKRVDVVQPKPKAAEVTTATVDFYVKSNNRPTQANIFLDNSFIGKTDRKGTLEVNGLDINRVFTVKVSKEGYTSTTRQFTVAADMPSLVFDIESKKAVFGTLIIDAVPIADKVFVDGKQQQKATPVRASLKYGKHSIRLVNSELGLVHEEEVDLKIGQILRVRHDFTQEEVGRVAVSVKNAAQYGYGFVYVDGQLWHEKHNTTPLDIKLPVGSHTIEVRRDGFSPIPRDVIVEVEKGQTKYVSFTLNKNQ